jgi:hypothetical protein
LSFSEERDDQRRRKSDQEAGVTHLESTAKQKKKRGAAPEVGSALRSAYQRTLDEHIPPEMLDLLGKLG